MSSESALAFEIPETSPDSALPAFALPLHRAEATRQLSRPGSAHELLRLC
jgi:hypothetical protein